MRETETGDDDGDIDIDDDGDEDYDGDRDGYVTTVLLVTVTTSAFYVRREAIRPGTIQPQGSGMHYCCGVH